MTVLFKKKDKDNKLPGGIRKKELAVEVDLGKIKTMPEKFLPKAKKRGGNYKIIIIAVLVLIVLAGTLGVLLTFTDVLDEIFFGKGTGLFEQEANDWQTQGLEGEPVSATETGETADFFRKEALNEKSEVIGVIIFERRKELEYLDLSVRAIIPEKETIRDENNNEFRIIGGVYSFEPGGVRLAEGDLKIELYYNQNYLDGAEPRDLKIINWENEPEINFLAGEVKELESRVEITVDTLPRGKIALATLVGASSDLGPDDGGAGEVEPQGVLPSSTDTDGDGLTDKEEILYGMNLELEDTDKDGIADKEEATGWYEVRVYEEPNPHLKVYENETEGYSLYYPALWTVEENAGIINILADNGEVVRVMIQDNFSGLSPRDWYLGQAEGVTANQIKVGQVNGLSAAWSLDQFTVYIARGEKIYLINYNVGLNEEASFKATFDGLVKSFHFPQDLITSYKYQNDKYGFSLNLPLDWEGYDVYNYTKNWGDGLNGDVLMFRLATQYPEQCNGYEQCATFMINVFDFLAWNGVRLLDKAPLLVNVNNDFVFAYSANENYGEDLAERMSEVNDIIETFVFE